jgi:c-di-GMP phosphodiesterase
MPEVFIARQPIYDRSLGVYAYELLFRSSEVNSAGDQLGDQATTQVLLNCFLEIGLDRIVGPHLAFINVTRSFILEHLPLPLPQGRLGLEILEDIPVDAELVEAVQRLALQGYVVALDDFIFHNSLRPLVDVADIVKIDVTRLDRQSIAEHVRLLRRDRLKLLAEKIETHEEFEFCHALGFDYFQGYFFCRPKVIRGPRLPGSRLAAVRLLASLQDPKTDMKELEQIITQDVSLSYRLLRYINSAFFALPRRIESIHEAVVHLGTRSIKTWITLFALSGIDDKPHELMTTAAVRARMCELLGTRLGMPAEACFTVGLISALDALLDLPMEEVIRELPLSQDIAAALTARKGPYGPLLHCVVRYERGEWEGLGSDLPLDRITIRDAYLEAVAWSNALEEAL